jgi:hypothetical protein
MRARVNTSADMYSIEMTGLSGTAVGPKKLPAVPPSRVRVAAPQASVALLQVVLVANSSIVTRAGQSVMLTATVVSCLFAFIALTAPTKVS